MPGRQLSVTAACSLLLGGTGKRTRGQKGENPLFEIKSVKYVKQSCACKQSNTWNSCTASHGQVDAWLFSGEQGFIRVITQELFRKTNAVTLTVLPSVCRGWAWHEGMDYPFGESGSAVPAVLPPSLFSTPTLPAEWELREKLGKLWLCVSPVRQ